MPLRHVPYYLANISFHLVVYITLIVHPFRNNLRYNLRKSSVIIGIYAILTCCVILLFFEQEAPFSQYAGIAIMLWVAKSVFACIMLMSGNKFRICFLIFVTANVQNNVIAIAKHINKIWQFSPNAGFEHASYLITTVGVLIVYLPFLWYIYVRLFGKIVDTCIDYAYWKYLCILPLSSFIFLHVSPFGGLFSDTNYEIKNLIALVLFNIMCVLCWIISLRMLLTVYESLTLQAQKRIMEKQIALQGIEYERRLVEMKTDARRRHDWRHHLLTINSFIKAKDYKMLETYLKGYLDVCLPENDLPVCQNTVADIILRHFMHKAKDNHIEIITDVFIPGGLTISDIDLCVVMGNLVENAFEACLLQKVGSPFIKIKASFVESRLFIMVQNSFSVPPKQVGSVFYSSKHSGEGLGIYSAKNVVETNGGFFSVDIGDDIFTVEVLIYNEKKPMG